MKLRAACLGVKVRAEDGAVNAVKAITRVIHAHHMPASSSASSEQIWALPQAMKQSPEPQAPVTVERPSKVDSARHEVGLSCYNDAPIPEGYLTLREMPNGVRVWCGTDAEEEAFFIYAEIFENKTYSRMGLHVRDGETLWDVGKL